MAVLNEGISKIEKGSALDIMYNRFLSGFAQASQEKLPDFTGPDYVTGSLVNEKKITDEIRIYEDITRKNSAYLFANTICSSLSSGGGDGGSGTPGAFVSISGDSMIGLLQALYGFKAGDNGVKILDVYQTTEADVSLRKNVVDINGELHLPSKGLIINGKNVMSYSNDVLALDAGNIALNSDVTCTGTIRLGDLSITKDGINYRGLEFYHSGNSNKQDVNWAMKDGTVFGNLITHGTSTFKSQLTSLNGAQFLVNSIPVLSILKDRTVELNGDMSILNGGVKFDGNYIIHPKNINTVSFSASNKVMNIGDDGTLKITLQSGLYDDDGEYELISKFGAAYFPESFKAGHGLGNTLISTYKVSSTNSGVVFHRNLKFKDNSGPGLYSEDGIVLNFESPFKYQDQSSPSVQLTETRKMWFGFKESESLFAPANRISSSLYFNTDADFYVFDKPIETKTSIGISGTKTRLLANSLFFSDEIYWLGLQDGVKHYGNSYFANDIGSVTFSDGFAGSGWAVRKNKLTGNVRATFDELIVRKKMRIYDLEVQKNSATNGAVWISDSCSGDMVEEIT